ncbi:TPM domain-containing protein [Paenibacillus piscarius]|uniref:TPM domain-containing protein n=1 Tax=Paenibacillus piscarius TaxID=1089681 RepID=UPI001EE8B74E|nr:TPM domain-containing protein [Paenibacillus piscarius]
MRKILALVLLLSLLWIPGVYAAAEVPAPQGVVTDEAGLLNSRQMDTLTRLADTDRYTFHVLIIDSLDGADPADYAADVYDTWGLKPRDILLLISYGDRQTELSFINQGLQGALDSWSAEQGGGSGSAAVSSVLETYFNPSARDGDFAGAISAVMKALDTIGSSGQSAGMDSGSGGAVNGETGGVTPDTGGAGSTAPGTGGSGSTAPETGGTTSGTGSTGTGVNGNGSGPSRVKSLLPLAAALIGAAVLVLLLYVVITGMRRRKALAEQREAVADLLVRANRALDSLQSFQGIVQGKTGELVEGISKRLTSRMVELSALQTAGQAPLPAFFRLSELKIAAEELERTEGEFRAALEEEEQKIAIVSEADRNVKQEITELKQDAPELMEQLQEASQETGYPLQEIAEDLQELAADTAKAEELELFDPIAAQEITAKAQETQKRIEQDMQDVEVYEEKLKGFPGVLGTTRTRIAGMIDQHSLHNMKVKPYERLEQAESVARSLEAPLHSGDMDEVRRIGAELDALLVEAVAMTERQATLRANNRRDLENVRSRWEQLTQRRKGLEGLIAEGKRKFVQRHLDEAEQMLEEAGAALRQGAGELPQVESWNSDTRAEYDQARSGLDQLIALQDETESRFNQISSSLDSLYERLEQLKRRFADGQSRVDAAYRLLQSRGISSQSRFQLSSLPEYAVLQQGLSSSPYNLEDLEDTERAYASQISYFVEEANRLVRQKEAAERAARMAMLQEQERREQERKRNSSGPPSAGGGGFGGGGFGGGGGRSSGGSSWGGGSSSGGRSSGGSSWGGGGGGGGNSGRSSGGSKW